MQVKLFFTCDLASNQWNFFFHVVDEMTQIFITLCSRIKYPFDCSTTLLCYSSNKHFAQEKAIKSSRGRLEEGSRREKNIKGQKFHLARIIILFSQWKGLAGQQVTAESNLRKKYYLIPSILRLSTMITGTSIHKQMQVQEGELANLD